MQWMDLARRRIGAAFDAFGLGPQEAPYRIAAALPGARLRAYETEGSGPVLLIVTAPFKRAYLWDLAPGASTAREALARGFRVYLLEWLETAGADDTRGLEYYALQLPLAATRAIEAESGVAAPILVGHSLGGTFAAIFASLHPERAAGLVLVDAPLAFGKAGGPLSAAARRVRHARDICRAGTGGTLPGSVVNTLSLAAAPEVFLVQRCADFRASLGDPKHFALHMRLERWALDESPLPIRLFEEIVEQLYRDDRFRAGTLRVGEETAALARLHVPVLAVVNPAGRIVPPASIEEGLAAASGAAATILICEPETGAMLQHLGPLVTPLAHQRLWPEIFGWALRLKRA